MLKIALLGYGRMGKAVEKEALERGHRIVAKLDQDNWDDLKKLTPDNCDGIIEFTHPESFDRNIHAVMGQKLPLVSGTTGWYERIQSYQDLVSGEDGAFLYASNFSVGVNLLFKLNRRLAELMNRYDQYDPFIEEQHHRYKADGPSGTAFTLARDLIERIDRKESVAGEDLRNRAPKDEELSVGFIRSGEIIGRHKVAYTSDIDTLSIEHHAHNRRGFALGAVIALEWLQGKKGFHEFIDTL
ncbi:MAG: 4-hydroxy-tetrahydrodipicolinate reductase [Bacteroidia bacterium]|nr:4-hydroxy-tetrahydrodipicolinate reductase [Bacteroidia bacterium]